jgi:hypothetical protein
VSGEFQEGDDRKFANLAILPDKAVVILDSPGGLAYVGIKIGEIINLKGFATTVMANATCASTCALVWLAGHPRMLYASSHVGFHAAFTNTE